MIRLSSNLSRVTIRKTNLSDKDDYYIILQHDCTRIYTVLEVSNMSVSDYFYEFQLGIPQGFPHGEYTYYIVDHTGENLSLKCNNILQGLQLEGLKVLQTGLMQYFKTNPVKSHESCKQFKQYEW